MKVQRLCFLSHFLLCLACCCLAGFAWKTGAVEAVWRSDESYMTSVIAALFVGTAVWLGWQAWLADGDRTYRGYNGFKMELVFPNDAMADFGHLAEGLAVRLGLIGTGVGIILTIKASLASANPLAALQTAFFSMICGVGASAIIAVMTHSLECGIKRARR